MDAQAQEARQRSRRRALRLVVGWTVLLVAAFAWTTRADAAYPSGRTRGGIAIGAVWLAGLLAAIPMVRSARRRAEAWDRACELLRIQRDLAVAANSTNDMHALAQQVLDAAVHIDGFDAGGIYLTDRNSGELHLIAHCGLSAPFAQAVAQFARDSMQARLAAQGQPVYGPQHDLTFGFDATRRQEGLRSIGIIPIVHAGRTVAVLALGSRRYEDVPQDSRRAIEGLSAHIGGVLARAFAAEEQRRYKARLQEAQKLECIGLLAGGIAHDFNNLLVGVLGSATLAAELVPEDSPVQRLLGQIERSAQRAAELTKQLLAYSGRGKLIVQPLDVSRVAGDTARLMAASVPKKSELVCHLADDLPAVLADETQLQQVVVNLIANAFEALGTAGGRIQVRTGVLDVTRVQLERMALGAERGPGRYVFLEVSDTGAGMDAATYARVFDPFFSTKEIGRGLGLPAVAGIVRGHNGAVDIDSGPGRGTTVRILLPVAARPAPTTTAPPLPAIEPSSGTILVVDDEEAVRRVAQSALESSGFRVLTAGDGEEALGVIRCRAQDIDAVLLDLTMPRLGGVEFVEQLRRMHNDVPVVLSSGFREQDAVARFESAGLAGFVQKPYKARALVAQVRSVLQRRQWRDPATPGEHA